ncbi:peptidylprolyl isomerase [Flavobacterium piscinae]|uniref:Peptidyl-prolyl cis-trans isomerase n=1 Tax=Flavobacterium piscinae TaxID=2506424 RepID=A0A4Q1KKX7_9FLAO|nr:peptidylprolyl isomerase [Flavobacterium piscinae]RXR30561.1 peptidylprolyl isomerase [Flavobacterium piscinae]
MKFHKLILFLPIVLLYSCEKKTKDTTEKNREQKIDSINIKNITLKPKYDLETVILTDDNVVDFLTWYGERNPENKVLIETKFGNIEVELFDKTPLHRANFIYLVKKNYFNTTYFHRVVKNFIIQGGNSDESITKKDRKNIGKYLIPSEFNNNLKHNYGALASARLWEENPNKLSNPYEFYLVQNKNGAHHLDNEHTVFGKITKGFDVMNEIANQETDKKEFPLLNIKIKVTVIN